MKKYSITKRMIQMLVVQAFAWTTFLNCAQAGFFKERILNPILGKSEYARCDTEKFSFEEESFSELWTQYNKFVRKSKFCDAAKTMVRIYLQHPREFNDRDGYVLILKNLQLGNYFLDFAWEHKNFGKKYPGSTKQEFVDTLRLRTYSPYLPNKARGYCIRPLGYFEDSSKKLIPLVTEAKMVANQFLKDWPESAYDTLAHDLLEEARTAEAEYLICTAEAKVGNWKRLRKAKKTPGPLLSAYRDLGSVIGAYQDKLELLPRAMLEMVKVLHMIHNHPDNNLDEHHEFIRNEDWAKKAQELQVLMKKHFPRAKETFKAQKYKF